jgi:potassium-transporting ATPase KdpC subunit
MATATTNPALPLQRTSDPKASPRDGFGRTLLAEAGPALRTMLALLALAGLAYPLLVTGAARLLFPSQAEGSLVPGRAPGRPAGSALIAQPFHGARWFQPRPSAAGEAGWDASGSSPSNLGPTSRKLRERVQAEVARLVAENPKAPGMVPAELVTTSGSGLDPHLSPEAARWQIPRIAQARGAAPVALERLVDQAIEGRTLWIFGEPRVNVLLLNLALERLSP